MKTEKISLREEIKAHLVIALPLAAAYLSEMGMVLTDDVIVGRLGALELAAVGLTGNVVWEVIVIAQAVIAMVGVLVAQAFGAEEHDRIGHLVRQGFWIAIALSIPTTIFCFYAADILSLSDQDPEVLAVGNEYLRTVAWCVLPLMLFTVLRCYVSSLSQATIVMVLSVGAIGLNVILCYGMVHGEFGFPKMGVAGAGWSTTIVCWTMLVGLVGYTACKSGLRRYQVYQNVFDLDLKECWQILRLGTPMGGIAMMEGGLFMAASIMMGTFGFEALAATQIVFGAVGTMFMISLAIGEAAGIRVAYGIGAGSRAGARQSGLLGLWMGAGFCVMAGLFFIFGSHMLVGFFLDLSDPANADILTLCGTLFIIASAFLLFDGLQAIASRVLRAMKDVFMPMWIAALGYWVLGIGSGYIFGFEMGYGPQGIWWGLAFGLCVTGTLLTVRYVILSKFNRRVDENAFQT